MATHETVRCIAPDCNQDCNGKWGAKVHWARAHGRQLGSWKPDYDAILDKRGKLSPSAVSPSDASRPKSFMDAMKAELLSAPDGRMAVSELISRLRQNGATTSKSDNALRTRIAHAAKASSDIVRVQTGVYSIRSTPSPAAASAAPPPVSGPDDSVVAMLRAQSERQSLAILGLTRIIASLVE